MDSSVLLRANSPPRRSLQQAVSVPADPPPRTALKQCLKAVSAGGDVRRRPSRSRPCLRAVPHGKASTRRYDVMGRTRIPLDAELM